VRDNLSSMTQASLSKSAFEYQRYKSRIKKTERNNKASFLLWFASW
jgi:hypothetical protein